jgi:hypothetical protein
LRRYDKPTARVLVDQSGADALSGVVVLRNLSPGVPLLSLPSRNLRLIAQNDVGGDFGGRPALLGERGKSLLDVANNCACAQEPATLRAFKAARIGHGSRRLFALVTHIRNSAAAEVCAARFSGAHLLGLFRS